MVIENKDATRGKDGISMVPAKVLKLTFLLYPCEEDNNKFVVHCLELDVVAVGDTRPAAIDLLKQLIEDLIAASIEDGTYEKILRPAPPEYWRMLARAKPYRPPQSVIEHHIRSSAISDVGYAQLVAV